MGSSICYKESNDTRLQNKLEAPIPWIGMYIALASAICSLAMAADVFRGFRSRKLWFPCKYFSLNATSLVLLTVTMKLSVDLSAIIFGTYDKIASVGSLVLMSTAVGNFMTSVASMDNNEILLNLTALGILVVNISANICIRNVQMIHVHDGHVVLAEEIAAIIFMFVLVVMLCFSSMVVSTTKRDIELKYEMHRIALNERREVAKFSFDGLRLTVRRHWVMAETGSPQFVMARSAISATSGLMCLLMAFMFVEAYVRVRLFCKDSGHITSNYKWSIPWILYIQFVGVVLGTIAPLSRWFLASWFKMSAIGQKSIIEEFKIEKYWTSRLMEWRERPLSLQIRHHRCKKLLLEAKELLLKICSGVLVFLVLTGKMVIFISAKFGRVIFLCFNHIKYLKAVGRNDVGGLESRDGLELDYVLLLEGEAVPERILRNICNVLDKLIERGQMKKLNNLMRLLRNKSANFNGVREFDRNELVPRLYSQEPPNCWSLPLVTLTSIAIALPNITTREAKKSLLRSVSEGLSLVKHIEKTLDRTGEMEGVKKAAYMVWDRVELDRKWLDIDLQDASLRDATLQKLSKIGEDKVKYFTTKKDNIILMQNPLNWPSKVIAANSMYRVTQTILLANEDNIQQTDEQLFDRLSVMISDILAACLTNLAHAIIFKCHNNTIKDRQESVRQAAVLLGESQEILGLDLPSLHTDQAANIEECRASMVHA